jgi:hypothetical protein
MNTIPVAPRHPIQARCRKTSNWGAAADVDGPVHHELRAGHAALP